MSNGLASGAAAIPTSRPSRSSFLRHLRSTGASFGPPDGRPSRLVSFGVSHRGEAPQKADVVLQRPSSDRWDNQEPRIECSCRPDAMRSASTELCPAAIADARDARRADVSRHNGSHGRDAISSQIVARDETRYTSIETFRGVGDASISTSAHVVGRCGAAHGRNEFRAGCR
jgi:hypothetical protein